MPTYVYREIRDDGTDGELFEVVQSMSETALSVHPTSGRPVKRVLLPFGLTTKYGDNHDKNRLSDHNLDRLGFTKYQKSDDGTYEKTAGTGPDTISRDPMTGEF